MSKAYGNRTMKSRKMYFVVIPHEIKIEGESKYKKCVSRFSKAQLKILYDKVKNQRE